jgi:protein SCO1
MLRFVFLAATLLAMTATTPVSAEDRLLATVQDHPTRVANFTLTDDNGATFTDQRLFGHWTLMAVGYTNCPDVCPFTLSDLDAIIHVMIAQPKAPTPPMVVFVAVDPARDKPVLKDWLSQFNPNFLGITGADPQIERLVTSIGGFYRLGKPDKTGYYTVTHSGGISVIGPEGRVRAHVLLPMPPKQTAAFLIKMMRGAAAASEVGRL